MNEQRIFLPTRKEAEILYRQYLTSVDPFAHILHKPSFGRLFKVFWDNIEAGIIPSNPTTALVFSVCMAAAISLSPLQTQAQLGTSRQKLVQKLKTGTERALARAHCMTTSNIRTLQAFTLYLVGSAPLTLFLTDHIRFLNVVLKSLDLIQYSWER
jgi:hypothetical protein